MIHLLHTDMQLQNSLGLKEILQLPANDVYVVEGEQEYMIPAVPEFILERNPDEGFIRVRLLEGMQSDAV